MIEKFNPSPKGKQMILNIIDNATCTFCGCVCDDIQLHSDDTRIHEAKKACVLGFTKRKKPACLARPGF